MSENTALVLKEKMDTVRDFLNNRRAVMAQALPDHLSIDRMLRVAMTAITKRPKLLDCDQTSLFLAIMNSIETGLELDTPTQEAHLIPYYNNKREVMEAQFQIGYRGLEKLARNSNQISSIEVVIVYENEKFECTRGLNPVLVHEPKWDGNRGEARLLYCIVRYKDATLLPYVEIMTVEEINKIKATSKAKNSGPWVDHWGEMAKKTISKRAMKHQPMSTSMARAIELDNKASMGESQLEVADPELLSELSKVPTESEVKDDDLGPAEVGDVKEHTDVETPLNPSHIPDVAKEPSSVSEAPEKAEEQKAGEKNNAPAIPPANPPDKKLTPKQIQVQRYHDLCKRAEGQKEWTEINEGLAYLEAVANEKLNDKPRYITWPAYGLESKLDGIERMIHEFEKQFGEQEKLI